MPDMYGQLKTVPPPVDSLVAKADEWFAEATKGDLFIEDAEAQAFVEEIMAELLDASGYDGAPFSVHLRNSLTINAAMYPNGNMVLTSGLLLRLNSREELAMIVGHELGHYLLEHFKDTIPADDYDADLRSLVQEYESDSMGVKMIMAAEMPAEAGISALEKLPPTAGGVLVSLPFFSIDLGKRRRMTHPPTPRRIELLRRTANVSEASVFSGSSGYHTHLAALRNDTRWDMLLDAKRRGNYTLRIITIDSLLSNSSVGDSSEYYSYLRFQQSEAILRLMRSNNSFARSDLQYGKSITTYRNNDQDSEEKYYSINIMDVIGADALKEVHALFSGRLKKNIAELSQTKEFSLESKRLEGLYLERLEQYADARTAITEYMAGKPTHPSRRFANSLLTRMPKKNRKQPKY